ncbi:rho GTPase-activating protein 21-like isoform X4 [Penaeus indicus]|uniref:rho GTPase-activating protein 21-like isoform X4 n=1 Tax=Penaeus indicus TaxID=29960 RepID=UPI00300C726B
MKEKCEGERATQTGEAMALSRAAAAAAPGAGAPPRDPDNVNGNSSRDFQLQTSRGGPRLITISRTDHGFGFTLRHFIVYPPELSELLADHGGPAASSLSSLEPLDTIFVKNVKPGSAAHLAGLRTGDRVVSVNGESVATQSYQQVVSTIQRSPPVLQLMVVPREEDLLQQVFGETAHNPESNLDVRMPTPSPGHIPPQQPNRQHLPPTNFSHSPLGIPQYPQNLSPSAWSSQSSLSSHISNMSTGPHPPPVMVVHPPFHQRPHQASVIPPPHGAHIPIHPHHQQTATRQNQANVQYRQGPRKHSLASAGDAKKSTVGSVNRKQSLPMVVDRKQAVYTIQNTISGVPHHVPSPPGNQSSLPASTNATGTAPQVATSEHASASVFGVYEPILDRAVGRGSFRDSRRLERDPDGRIYEVVQTRVVESKFNTGDSDKKESGRQNKGHHSNQGTHIGRKTSVGDSDVKRVRVQSLSPPRLKIDQVHARSASVNTRSEALNNNGVNEGSIHGSHQSLNSTKSEGKNTNRQNSHSRKSYSEPISSNKENYMTDDKSTQEVIERIKKDTERKEEFLRRPNQPIWLPASKSPVIHSDYHVNPQKFQRPIWPPPGAQTPPSPGAITKALTFIVAPKQDHSHLRRVKSEIEQRQNSTDSISSMRGSSVPAGSNLSESSIAGQEMDGTPEAEQSLPVAQGASGALPRSLVVNAVPKPYVGSASEANPANLRFGKSFTTTLSRIQENIPIPEYGSSSSLTSQGQTSSKQGDTSQGVTPGGTPSGSQTSLNSASLRSIPLAWVGDNERIKQLQIVSRRAKQFESSQLEKEASAKSAFHRFELSRLSQRSKIPNVAQRKQEFETKDQLPPEEGVKTATVSEAGVVRRVAINRTIPVGGPHIHCEPPPLYGSSHRPQSDPDVLERERSNSVCSQVSMTSLLSTQSMDETGSSRQKAVARQNSYLSALRSPLHDGELAKKPGDPKPPSSSPITETSTPSFPQPATTTTPTGGHALRPKRPTFLPIKNHARPALSSNDKQSPSRVGKGLEERTHESLSLYASTNQKAHPSSALNSLPNSMYQFPAVAASSSQAHTPGAGGGTGVPGGALVTSASTPTAATTSAPTTTTTASASAPEASSATTVARRNKAVYEDEGERLVRRVSYLKATSGDRMYSDSELDSDTDDKSGSRSEGLEGVVADGGVVSRVGTPVTPGGPLCVGDLPSPASLQSAILRQGSLHVKLTMVDGKRAGDRSWKTVWAVVQGHALIFYKDRQHALQTPLGVEDQISLRGAEVEVASDYTKRRNVLRLATPGGSQLLLQADTPPEMLAWLSTLQNNCAIQEGEACSKTPMNNNNVSPQTSNKAMRKLTSSLRTRSPTGQSPSTKTRKPSSVESNSSPKSKTWRGNLVRPFMKKIQGGSPAITPTTPQPEGATIGVCLEDCPQSDENEFVPLLVALCVSVVETRGLQTQGIYRIPGNKAAVTHLTEMINKGPKAIDYSDPRWSDVNVISSMLKQFFQKLPDPLFTCDLYPLFIEASKIEDPNQRLMELRRLVQELPDHHYETLRFLMLHLSHIVSNSESNKMDVRNLAIVFGPTLVRSGDDNMITMVTDMSHQCKIVETLIGQAAWFFNEDDGEEVIPPSLSPSVLQSSASDSLSPTMEPETPSSQALLLHNIQKVEGAKGDLKKDIVSSIISAANRKVHKVKYKKPVDDKPVDDIKYSDKEGGFEERDIDKEAELRKQRLLAKQIESMVELPDPKPMSERKISNMSLMSVHGHPSSMSSLTQSSERTSASEQGKHSLPEQDGRLFCVIKKDALSSSTPPPPGSSSVIAPSCQQSSQLTTPETSSLFGDEVAIRSYAGLSASTQERIRRFEMETRAMLHRDLTKHRRETERRDVERRRLEELWQRAKQDMESEDILDQLADNPTEVVRKISDYSWRLQGLSESMGGDQGSLTSQSSSTSSQTGLISAALSHHPLSNTSLTPTTNATTQVPNNDFPQLPTIQVDSEPVSGLVCERTNDAKHGLTPQQSHRWLEYNAASPHSTLGSTSSSSSSGYGSLTRSSLQHDADFLTEKPVEDSYQNEHYKIGKKPSSTTQQLSPSVPKKKKSSKGSGFLFGLTSSSSSPSLFPSMAEAGTELTPTRKIGQTIIYPESPRPPPHNSRPSSQNQSSHITAPSSTLTPQPSTPILGRQKDSLLHHILPSRLYHSPRPLRRGSSAENVTQPHANTLSPSTFNTQKVVNNGTLKRARASRDQVINGPEMGMPRCGSLDSLRDGSHIPHDDGSDLLSAITATFEEKMRSLQESPLGLVTPLSEDATPSPSTSPEAGQPNDCTTRGKSECRLYRDPSLHRRRTNPRNPSANTSTNSTAVNTTPTTTISQVEDASPSVKLSEGSNKLNEDVTREVKVKRSDSLTKSEKTENNLKEKTEKRARELKRTDTQESLNEKKPKEMKRSDGQDGLGRSRDLPRKSESRENSIASARRSSDVRSRRHNVKELKEKFEQNTDSQPSSSPMKPSNSNHYNNISSSSNKTSKSSMRRSGYRGHIKRRHTVGGTKDLAKWAWLHSGEMSRSSPRSTRLSAWERLQPLVADERLNTDRSLEAWLARERIRTSSPDLSRPQQLVLPCDMDDKENLHRRLSVQEAVLNPLYPVLESHV